MVLNAIKGDLQSTDSLYPNESGYFGVDPEQFYDDIALTDLTPGQSVTLTLASQQFAPRLELRRADDLSRFIQQATAAESAQLAFDVAPGVNYVLRVTSQLPEQVGAYQLNTSAGMLNPVPPYRAEALTQAGQYRWTGRPLGRPTTLTYNFMKELPAYYKPRNGRWDEGTRDFKPMTAVQRTVVELALQAWASVSGLKFKKTADDSKAQLRFGTAVDADNDLLGWAYSPGMGVGQWSGDMWLNHREPSNRNPKPGSYGFSTVLHEIGHALGLSHPFDEGATLPKAEQTIQYTVMAYENHPNFPKKYQPSAPMLIDIEAIQQLYGKNLSTNRGNTVYRWRPGETFIETIYDAGGTDTINARNQRQKVAINLEAGQFSSVGTLRGAPVKDNLTIALGVIIENAIGSSKDDSLTGNQGANDLTGNAGADVLIGLAGNDQLTGGAGNDTFVFQTEGDGVDTITDFVQGSDIIDVSSLLKQIGYSGTDPFLDGVLTVALQPGATIISLDRDGLASSAATPLAILQNFTDTQNLLATIKVL